MTLLDAVQDALRGRYVVERELGRGGMGAVFLARDLALERPVAVKVLPPEMAAQPELRARFLRETRLAASFSHPNIVQVYSVEDHPQVLAFVMAYIEGETLAERIQRTGALPADQVVRFMQEAAWALGYAHARGVVHRDVKPDNVMLERATGRSLLMDFGIARSDDAQGLTQAGTSLGTPAYMSPEQAAGEVVDHRSDLYSLGCAMYAAAAGQAPFTAGAAHQVLAMHLTRSPEPLTARVPGFPAPLAAVIERCLHKDPAERFASAEALAEALQGLAMDQRQIDPMLRLFQQQATQAAQLILMFVPLLALVRRSLPPNDDMLRAMVGTIFWTLLIATFYKLWVRVNHLVRLGFEHRDVVRAFTATADELALARDRLMADPHEVNLLRRIRRGGVVGAISGAVLLPVLRGFGTVTEAGRSFGPVLSILALGAAGMIGMGVAMAMARPARSSIAQRLAARLWAGPLGRTMFRRASAAMPAVPRDA